MKELNIDVASEYLVMAATLAYIKSRMLLPSPPKDEDEQEGVDPREELIQRLLEYQRYKKAAAELREKDLLGRDVFTRSSAEQMEDEEIEEASLFDLMDALRGILTKIDAHDKLLAFTKEHVSLKEKIVEILERLANADYIVFQDLFLSSKSRFEVIVTFMAMLELMRDQKIVILQFRSFGMIRIYARSVRGEQ
jgi:segregation and condensation protein A